MANRRFGTDGIRGRVGEDPITPDQVLRLGWAAGRYFARNGAGHVLIGKDTRISGYMIESVLESGLAAAGVNVTLLRVMPTPAVAYLTRTLRADAGIVISASHNPYHDNGIKFFDGMGNKLPDEVEAQIEALWDEPMSCVSSDQLGKATRMQDVAGRYIEFCKASVDRQVSLKGLKIVLDCANGATYHIASGVFEELGADVVCYGNQPNGTNINDGCGSTSPQFLQSKVVEHGADLGIAFDGDGDRVVMVDHTGAIVDGDQLLYVIAQHRLQQGNLGGGLVGTVMSNFGLERACLDAGINFERAAVGDRYVLERLKANGWQVGGETSGHILCLDRATTGDAIVSALQVLVPVATNGRTLAELHAGMEKLPQLTINVQAREPKAAAVQPSVTAAIAANDKRLAGRGRVVVRPSGTEPVVRVMVEGEDSAEVESIASEIADVVRTA